ncbi:hypothetical protein [Mesorhizobium sp. KR9-304]
MKRKRFTEQQIIAVLREHEARAKAGDLAVWEPLLVADVARPCLTL